MLVESLGIDGIITSVEVFGVVPVAAIEPVLLPSAHHTGTIIDGPLLLQSAKKKPKKKASQIK